MKLTVEQRIERAHVQLMQNKDWCLFSGLFMVGKVEVRDNILTAQTNGRDVAYGRKFVASLDDKMLNFVILHETMHKAYRHLTTWKQLWKENARRANMACDYVINLQIKDVDPNEVYVAMPRDADGNIIGLIDQQYRGMDAMQVYRLLGQKEGDEGGEGEEGEEGGRNGGGSFDEHDWEGAEEMSEKEKQELANEIDHALREGTMLAGKMNGKVPREVDDLLHPQIDWRDVLREFIKSHARGGDQSTWRKPHRKYLAVDLILPSTYTEKAETIAIGVDTSGSIGGKELSQFLGEIKSICDEVNPDTVELLYWDSKVASHETYQGGAVATLTDSTKPRGGGGTSPECVPVFLRDKMITPQCVVMLTDGCFYSSNHGDWQGMPPVLWCVMGNKSFVPKVGKCVHIN